MSNEKSGTSKKNAEVNFEGSLDETNIGLSYFMGAYLKNLELPILIDLMKQI